MSISTSSFYGSQKKRLLVGTSPLSSKRQRPNHSPFLPLNPFDSVHSAREVTSLSNKQPLAAPKENVQTKKRNRIRKIKARVKRTRLDNRTSKPDKENISRSEDDNLFSIFDTPSKSNDEEKLDSLNDSETSSPSESDVSGYCLDAELHHAKTSLEVSDSPKKSPSKFPIFNQAAKRPRYIDINLQAFYFESGVIFQLFLVTSYSTQGFQI